MVELPTHLQVHKLHTFTNVAFQQDQISPHFRWAVKGLLMPENKLIPITNV